MRPIVATVTGLCTLVACFTACGSFGEDASPPTTSPGDAGADVVDVTPIEASATPDADTDTGARTASPLIQQTSLLVENINGSSTNTLSFPTATTVGDLVVVVASSSPGQHSVEAANQGIAFTGFTDAPHVLVTVSWGFVTQPFTDLIVTWEGQPTQERVVLVGEWKPPGNAVSKAANALGNNNDAVTATLAPSAQTLLVAIAATEASTFAPSDGFAPLDSKGVNYTFLSAAWKMVPAGGTYSTSWNLLGSNGWSAYLLGFSAAP